jgi:hypothetical protein
LHSYVMPVSIYVTLVTFNQPLCRIFVINIT